MTIIPFNLPVTGNFQFSPVLGGVTYIATVTWNLYGQRYYIQIATTTGNVIMYRPVVGSPPEYDINLAAGYFKTSTLVFRTYTNSFEVAP